MIAVSETTKRRGLSMVRRRTGRRWLGAALVAVMALPLLASHPAEAQDADVRALNERLQRLERDLRTLERAAYRGETPPPSSAGSASSFAGGSLADAEIRMTRIEDEMRRLTGRIEEVNHGIEIVRGRLDKLVADVDFRLSEIERRMGQQPAADAGSQTTDGTGDAGAQTAAAGATDSTAASGDGAPRVAGTGSLPAGTPMERYNFARSLLTKLDYDGAEQAFRAFIAEHGNDQLAGNAYYWLGETYYARGRLDDAARVFLDGFQRFPDGNKAPDTLLKLAITLRSMSQVQEACATLSELRKRFPQVTRPVARRLEQEWQSASCV